MATESVLHTYKELVVWQKGIILVTAIYKLTESFPREEVYGLTSQMRRSAVSVPSNIAEGRCRGTKADFLHFLRVAFGSVGELDTQVIIAKSLSKTKDLDYTVIDHLISEEQRMLSVMIRNMNPRS